MEKKEKEEKKGLFSHFVKIFDRYLHFSRLTFFFAHQIDQNYSNSLSYGELMLWSNLSIKNWAKVLKRMCVCVFVHNFHPPPPDLWWFDRKSPSLFMGRCLASSSLNWWLIADRPDDVIHSLSISPLLFFFFFFFAFWGVLLGVYRWLGKRKYFHHNVNATLFSGCCSVSVNLVHLFIADN